VPTITVPPEGPPQLARPVRFPMMRRSHQPRPLPTGRRHRHHAPRFFADPGPRQARTRADGRAPTRDQYRALLREAPVDILPPKVRRVLEALADTYEAGPGLADVTCTQTQLQDALVALDDESGGAPWGWSLRAIQRLLGDAYDLGWLSVADVPVPNSGWQMNRYRFHIPAPVADLWKEILARSAQAQERVDFEKRADDLERDLEAALNGTAGPGRKPGKKGEKPVFARNPHAGPVTFVRGLVNAGTPPDRIRAEIANQYRGQPAQKTEALDALATLSSSLSGS
jgi:hypothetical protein